MERTEQRRSRLRRLVAKNEAEAILVTSETNVTYLTGFTGDSSFLLLLRTGEVLITDGRYTTQLEEECPGLELYVRGPAERMHTSVDKVINKAKVGRLLIEADSITLSTYQAIDQRLDRTQLVPSSGLVEQLRQIKDRDEVNQLRVAIQIAERAFAVVQAALRPEQTEREVAHSLEQQIRLFGGEGCSFAPIVAVGPRAALPHATPGHAQIGDDDFTLIDWGARANGYASDLTRVLVTGRISPKLERIYGVVLNAQRRAIDAIRPGALMKDVDAAARKVIERSGHAKHFTHSLGHGIGLEIHEAPRLAQSEDRPLKAGMIVTVEPGIYLPGWGGVRIEDDVLVTRGGHEVLSHVPNELSECVMR